MISSEAEALRQEILAGLQDPSDDQDIEALFAFHTPGSFGMHEALHMSCYFLEALHRELLEHPALLARPDLFAKAYDAHEALFQLYQAIGAVHMADGAVARENPEQVKSPAKTHLRQETKVETSEIG